jgi:hypothetical protein
MKERLPDELAAIIASYHDGYQSGRTEGELTAALREKISRVIDVQRALADDAVLVDLAKLYAEQYAALGAKDPTLCYLYASGTGGTRNFSSDIPQPLIQRENALSEQVIATAAPRPDAAAGTVTASWEKVMRKLGGRFSLETINLVRAATLDASRHRDYCRVSVVLFREISNLEQREAALLIRQMLGDRK